MKSKYNKSLITIAVMMTLIIVGIIGYFVYDKLLMKNDDNEVNETQNQENLENSELDNSLKNEDENINYLTWSGMAEVEGYAKVEKRKIGCHYPGEECINIDYVVFDILEIDNQEFLKYYNKFYSKEASEIGLGCINNSNLIYYNLADELPIKKIELSENETSKIINSTKENPIKLQIVKLKFTGGIEPPTCYSDINSLKVIE